MQVKHDWDAMFTWLLCVVKALPYKPSLRWTFYRAMERFGLSKDDWTLFKDNNANYRRAGRSGWRRDTLADSVRSVDYRGHEPTARKKWLHGLLDLAPNVGIWAGLDFYVEVWFESEAMKGQFDYYVGEPYRITTRPFRGDYTIPMKDEAARMLRWAVRSGKKAVVLYFGDADKKGVQIPESAVRDVRDWSGVDFRFRHGGLTAVQARKLGLPENPERPGKWQWDALSDEQARSIILGVLREEVEVDRLARTVKMAAKKRQRWVREVRKSLDVLPEAVR